MSTSSEDNTHAAHQLKQWKECSGNSGQCERKREGPDEGLQKGLQSGRSSHFVAKILRDSYSDRTRSHPWLDHPRNHFVCLSQ